MEVHDSFGEFKHTSDLDTDKIRGSIDPSAPVRSTRIRVGRNVEGFGFSPGISQGDRLRVHELFKSAFNKLAGNLEGKYFPLLGMEEETRTKLADDHFLFLNGDKTLIAAGMERAWPEGRGIYHNDTKTLLAWVNEEDHLRLISMQAGGDIKRVFDRLVRGLEALEASVRAESGREFALHERYGYLNSCPTNLGTGMRAAVHIDLPGWKREGLSALKGRCNHLSLKAYFVCTGSDFATTFDISNVHRLGRSEVWLVQNLIDGINVLFREDLALQRKHGVL